MNTELRCIGGDCDWKFSYELSAEKALPEQHTGNVTINTKTKCSYSSMVVWYSEIIKVNQTLYFKSEKNNLIYCWLG